VARPLRIGLKVQYFTDFFKSNILRVRDEVLCQIWDGFEKAGIGVPYPQRDLYIKEWPGDRPGASPRDRGREPDVPLLEKAPVGGVSSGRFAKT
jgi:small-conductance mechanosensitive channel